MKLIDLAVSEKKATDKIIKGMDGIRNTVERISTVNESKKYRKEQILIVVFFTAIPYNYNIFKTGRYNQWM